MAGDTLIDRGRVFRFPPTARNKGDREELERVLA
jgi:hypothetical protein